MSPNLRRWAVHVLRIAVTGVAVWLVVRMIRWQDYWFVIDQNGKGTYHDHEKIKSVSSFSRMTVVKWADGREEQVSSALERQGFLSLFDHVEHTLVMGLEEYHFAYYWKLGLPLIVIGIGVPLSFLFWPPGRTGGIIRPLLR